MNITEAIPSDEVSRIVEKHIREERPEIPLHHSMQSQVDALRRLLSDPFGPEALADRDLGPQGLLVRLEWTIWPRSPSEAKEIEEMLRLNDASCEP